MVVKICANKSIYDALSCLLAGADIVGVLVGQEHNSDDFIGAKMAKEIVDYVNGRCDVSLVTHLTSAKEIIELTKFIGNNIIQLHSDINESEVKKIRDELPYVKLVRLIHISVNGDICSDIDNIEYVDYYLLDSFNLNTNQVGGTGISHDWNKSRDIISKLDKPCFLAGGLNPDNVRAAIKKVRPYGVDVNSGCKDNNGCKDRNKVKLFVKNAKNWSCDYEKILFV